MCVCGGGGGGGGDKHFGAKLSNIIHECSVTKEHLSPQEPRF